MNPPTCLISDMKSIIILFFVLLTTGTFCQNTFSKRFNFNFPACILTGVVPTDSCFYVGGIIADSLFPFNNSNVFVKFNLDGEPLLVKTLKDTIKTYGTGENTLLPLADGGFVMSGYTIDSLIKALIIKYDKNGDTLFTKEYLNPHYPNAEFIRPMDFQPAPDGGYVMVNWLGTSTIGNSDISVIKLDSLFEVEWHKIYGNNRREIPKVIQTDAEGNIYVGARRANNNLVATNYTYQTYIFKLDKDGNQIWEYLSDISEGLKDFANDLILDNEGNLYSVAGSNGTEIGTNLILFEKNIFKLNQTPEKDWEREFFNPRQPNDDITTNLLKLSTGEGMILCGTEADDFGLEDTYVSQGWLTKMSFSGDSIWTRRYVYLNTSLNAHEFYDIKETPDGGFILCGQSRDREAGAQIPQQGWLLKLDEYGCLVPGCHLIDDIIEFEDIEFELKLFPNPVSDFLNVFFRNHSSKKDFTFSVIDVSGKIIDSFVNREKEATLMISVSDYMTGTYFLRLESEGRILKTEKIIIQK